MRQLSTTDLLYLLAESKENNQTSESRFSHYWTWSPLSNEFVEQLEFIGTTANPTSIAQHGYTEYPSVFNYWSPDSPIALAYYPYHDCQVYRHKLSGCYFFIYSEQGGHVPERRCRLIRQHLIIPETDSY